MKLSKNSKLLMSFFIKNNCINHISQTKNTDEIAKFKAYTESYAGDNPTDPKWIKRWTEFIEAVEKETTDESKKKLISKFLSAQRKKKMDRKQYDNT